MDPKNKIALWAAAAVVVLAAGGVWLYQRYEMDLAEQELQGTAPIPTSTSTHADSRPPVVSSAGVGSPVNSPSLSYAQAVNVYAQTRIQFDADCRMLPTNPVFKNGSTAMFDNRHRDGRYFRLDGTRYYIPGYGFKLLKLTAQKLPHVVDVDCGTGQNTGTITLN